MRSKSLFYLRSARSKAEACGDSTVLTLGDSTSSLMKNLTFFWTLFSPPPSNDSRLRMGLF